MVKVSEWFKKEVGTISLLLKNWEEQHCKSIYNYFHIHLAVDQVREGGDIGLFITLVPKVL